MTAILTAARERALQSNLTAELAANEVVRHAYALVLEKMSETSALQALVLAGGLRNLLGNNPTYVAAAIAHKLAETLDEDGLEALTRDVLKPLKPLLRYFLPVAIDTRQFRTMEARWQVESDRMASDPDAIKLIRLAGLADSIHRKEWHNMLQKQRVLSRASTFVAGLSKAAPPGSPVAKWVAGAKQAVEDGYLEPLPSRRRG